jgi:hypothetical protein
VRSARTRVITSDCACVSGDEGGRELRANLFEEGLAGDDERALGAEGM